MILLFKTVLNPVETMLKYTETSKKNQILKKNCYTNFKFLEKIAEILEVCEKKWKNFIKVFGKICNFFERTAEISRFWQDLLLLI